jgi:hypothetical protein
MAEETKVESTENATQVVEETKVDEVEAAIVAEIETFEKKEKNREGYNFRKTVEETQDIELEEEKVSRLVQKELSKVLPTIQASTEAILLEQKLNALTDNPSMRKLIKLHFENSVNPGLGSVDERLEAAQAIATRKQTAKIMNELTVAAQNRSQIQNASQGSNSESRAVSDGVLSDNQLNELKRRGWNDEKITRFKQNLIKNRGAM